MYISARFCVVPGDKVLIKFRHQLPMVGLVNVLDTGDSNHPATRLRVARFPTLLVHVT